MRPFVLPDSYAFACLDQGSSRAFRVSRKSEKGTKDQADFDSKASVPYPPSEYTLERFKRRLASSSQKARSPRSHVAIASLASQLEAFPESAIRQH